MRHAAAFLLLLVLPGLLLPAGMLLHVCRCEALVERTVRSCCQHETNTAAARTCCHHRPATPSPRSGEGLPRASQDDCGCEWLPLPDAGQDPLRPAAGFALPDATPLPAGTVVACPSAAAPAVRPHRPAACRPPPPPDRERNLPLRL